MRFSFKRAMGKKIFFTAFILEKLPNNISIVQSKFDKSDVIFDITQWIIKSMLKKIVHVSVVCNAEVSELTCWFWPIQVEQWMKLSSSPQSETEGRGERGELINKTREDRENNVSLLIKTGNQTQKHRHQTITVAESSTQMAINPPTFLSLPATHTHTHTSCPETVVYSSAGAFSIRRMSLRWSWISRRTVWICSILSCSTGNPDRSENSSVLFPDLHKYTVQMWLLLVIYRSAFSKRWACGQLDLSMMKTEEKNYPCDTRRPFPLSYCMPTIGHTFMEWQQASPTVPYLTFVSPVLWCCVVFLIAPLRIHFLFNRYIFFAFK